MMSPQEQLEEAVLSALPKLWKLAPELATRTGAVGWDHLLPDPSVAALEARAEAYEELIDLALRSSSHLGVGQSDVLVLQARVALWRFAAFELRNWERNPDAFSHLGGLLFHMLLRQGKDKELHFRNLAERCRAIPSYLVNFRRRLTRPDRLWVDTAKRITTSMDSLFSAMVPSAVEAGVSEVTLQLLDSASRDALAAAKDHGRWLSALTDAETVSDHWLLSDEDYGQLLELKHLGLTIDQVEEIGREQLALRTAQRDAHTPPTGPAPTNFREALAGIRSVIDSSQDFVRSTDFASFPSNEQLVLKETPSFLRPVIPFAALLSAGPLAPSQRSFYLVSDPADGNLNELRLARITGVAVHEGYPGHHLQLSAANERCSLLRARIVSAPGLAGEAELGTDLVEGWAHYVEEKMQNEGFGCIEGSRWVLRNDQVWRAARILIDARMCRGKMSTEDAVEMLQEQAGLSKLSAQAEVRRYTSNPTYQLCYLIGKLKLEQLKDDLLKRWGNEGSERRFHDVVLGAGSIPVEMLRSFVEEEREIPGGSC
jgi:hypothetical protein